MKNCVPICVLSFLLTASLAACTNTMDEETQSNSAIKTKDVVSTLEFPKTIELSPKEKDKIITSIDELMELVFSGQAIEYRLDD